MARLEYDRVKYTFVFPGIIWMLLFTIFPLLYSLFRLSLFIENLDGTKSFVGFDNYIRVFQDYRFWAAIEVTLLFVVCSVILTLLLGLMFAILFNRVMKGLKIFRAIFTLPLFTPAVAVGYLGMMIFYEQSGPINSILARLGLSKIHWLSSVIGARLAVILVDAWMWTPFCFLVLLAGLQSLPEELYEAVRIDTNSGWQTFRHITFPLLAPILTTVTLLRIVEAFKIMDIPFGLTNGGPGLATRTLSYFAYTAGLRNFDLGYASAVSYILLVIMLFINLGLMQRFSKIYEDD